LIAIFVIPVCFSWFEKQKVGEENKKEG
jgi:hypothetical protein